ncbi:hypothetical protein KUV50_04260 [Membranicola marinus]|uniref:Uncharacterized protein n=1 Tax=Membranihabitans marinus TaxID=1227546 RepID=A0A953HKG8_9BACT|nr:hypothetical protein [Membranihabitans marinus]MBY5957337.1 hypothetical protein [Membranihabitans marinus]
MKNIILTFLLGSLAWGCTPQLSHFTQSLVQQYQYDDQALQKIQFYLSDDIILHRALRQGESTIEQGRISIRNGRRVEEIVFPKGTPGVFVFSPGKDRLAISFERKADHYLIFGPAKNSRGYRGEKGVYRLLAKEWKKDYGIVTYGDKEYATPGRSAYVGLLVDIDEKGIVNRRVKEVGGRTVR